MKVADAIGRQFGHLLVLKKSKSGTGVTKGSKKLMVLVRCTYNGCGQEFDCRLDNIVAGASKSCGCAPKRPQRKPRAAKRISDVIWKTMDKIAKESS